MKLNNLCTTNMEVVLFLMVHYYNWDAMIILSLFFLLKLMAEVTRDDLFISLYIIVSL